MRKIITLCLLLLAVFPLKASTEFDFLFVHRAEDGESYLYAYDFDGDAQQLLEEPIQDYDVFEHWIIYPSETTIMRLDVESGETIVFYECSEENPCGVPHFGADENTIFFRQVDTSQEFAESPSLFRLSLGAEPENISGANVDIFWLTENHILLVNDPMGEAALLTLYDVRTGTYQEVEIDCFFCGGVSFLFRSDAQQYLTTYPTGLTLKSITGETIYLASFPQLNLDFFQLEAWNPLNETVVYTAFPIDENFMTDGGNHLFLFDVTDRSTRTLWQQEDFQILGIRWNPGGSQFLFNALPITVTNWHFSDYQIWLYDMETEEATALSLMGYNVQWIE